MEFRILKKRLDIGRQFDDFLDKVSEAGLLFKTGVDAYLSDNIESFEKKESSFSHSKEYENSFFNRARSSNEIGEIVIENHHRRSR